MMLKGEIAAPAPVLFTLNMNQAMSEEKKKPDQRILDFIFQTDSHEYRTFLILVNFLVQLRATESADILRVRP